MNLKPYPQSLKDKNSSPTTIETYQRIIGYYGKQPLSTENILAFVKQLNKSHEPATCQLYVAALKSYAKFQKIISIDWERIKNFIPKKMKKFFTTINQGELTRLKQVKFEKNNWLYERNNLMLDFLFYSGLRANELVNIKHRDWEGNSLRIHGKGNKIRHVFLPDFLVKHLQPRERGYLFTSQLGKKITADQVREVTRQRTKLAGINKWVSPHTFRRSFATLLDRRGARLTTISKLLGHSSSDTTLGYIHNDFNTLYEDYSKIFQERPKANQSLRDYSTAELLAEISQRAGGIHA